MPWSGEHNSVSPRYEYLARTPAGASSISDGRTTTGSAADRADEHDGFYLPLAGVILNRLGQRAVFTVFVQDVLIDGGVALTSLPPTAMYRVVAVMDQFGLDFDDACQYVAAERDNVGIINFDAHFDQTDRGRQTPAQVLATLRRP